MQQEDKGCTTIGGAPTQISCILDTTQKPSPQPPIAHFTYVVFYPLSEKIRVK